MTISRQALFGKLGATLFRSIESATSFGKLRGNPYVELVHWVHQLLQLPDSDLHRIVRHAGIERDALERDIARMLAVLPAGASTIDLSTLIEAAVERAWVLATLEFNEQRIRGAWLFAALAGSPELRRHLTSISPQFNRLPADNPGETFRTWVIDSPEAADSVTLDQAFGSAAPGEASQAISASGKTNPLEQYCSDLTARARAGEIDPVTGRETENHTLIDILLRRRQNNPLLTGEAGVGKTAVVEGLALAIANGNVPPALSSVRLMTLDVGALLAGASMKGEFESRLKGVIEAAIKSPAPIILFVDEFHTLVGAGGQAGTGDAANLLKPALARGGIRMIGATTWSEYKRHIEKDPALTRRFQVLQVAEPQEAAAIDMVRSLAGAFASHHGVVVRDEAIRAAVLFSHRYIPSRQLPDKAISLLDTACARVALSQHAVPRELDHVRQRLRAAQVEMDLLSQEARIGLDAGAAVVGIQARIDTLALEEAAIAARWHAQRAAAQALVDARGAVLAHGGAIDASAIASGAGTIHEVPAPEAPPSRETLQALKSTLRDLQGELPLVFPEVDEAIVAEIVSDWTGIPVGRMVTDELATVRNLPDMLQARVIGQTQALRQIAERVQTARAGLSDPKKPLGVFLLAGPSGVGKTETALAVAEALYGGEQNTIVINMSEYQEAHTVSGLKGAPPGYVGYGEGGVLTEAVRRRPYSVVLLDEIEKAHHDVHEMFFQVFDKGYMEDGDGRYIDFRNTTILLTSNAASELTASLCADASLAPDQEQLRHALAPELLKTFPAAFLGRVTIVPYRPLAHDSLASIVRLHLERVVRRMADVHGITLTYDDAVVEYVVAHCLVQETGARVLIGFIEQHILPRLASLWLDALTAKCTPAGVHVAIADAQAAPADAFVFGQRHTSDASTDRSPAVPVAPVGPAD
ncbi:type VI secretion system ATPase TssH [Paraburkholderia tropica]|uniref:Type VI secretion system protein VasG n=1 Tax=Paraburkholderia tropica TaxID=92647 RepID=A0AAQ1JUD7_9BURK|nr:type VI secretion system ATPase TssH [Paraburkholderia tropica]RQN39305.1 type VI secretion system ATPase TssH [Paraburkholderia tropica]SEJ70284.1 type VI secretion system protein VasG [Paraburkholderia tropica]